MNVHLRAQLEAIHEMNQQHDAGQPDRLKRWRSVEPDSAAFLAWLVQAKSVQRVLEIGTSNGYSTLWLADAVGPNGCVDTVEMDADRSRAAQAHAMHCKLTQRIHFHVADAEIYLASAQAHEFIFLDAERSAYLNYWPMLARMLAKPGAVLVVDNAVSHAHEVAPLLKAIRADSFLTKWCCPLGRDCCLSLVFRQPETF